MIEHYDIFMQSAFFDKVTDLFCINRKLMPDQDELQQESFRSFRMLYASITSH